MKRILLALLLISGMVQASPTPDAEVYRDIQDLMGQKRWEDARALFEKLSPDFRALPDVTRSEATAAAGLCGFDFNSFLARVGLPGAPFLSFMQEFLKVSVDISQCDQAQKIVESRFGKTEAARTAALGAQAGREMNTFMAVLGMAKIGAQLKHTADWNDDGTVDPWFDACSPSELGSRDAAHVASGLGLLMNGLSSVEGFLEPSTAAKLRALEASCDARSPNPCTFTDAENADLENPAIMDAVRGVIRSSSIGIQTCASEDPLACCP